MWLFKRKEKCIFHEWKMSDFKIHYSIYDVERLYEITCVKCNKSRVLEEYGFEEMTRLGLIKE